MSANWQALTGELVPLALIVALSPFSVIPPLLLVLHAPRPRPTGLAFAIGWLVGLGLTTAIFLQIPRALGGADQTSQTWSAYARIGIGGALVLGGLARWLTRGRAASSPAWLNSLSKIRPAMALLLGIVLPLLNPKFLFANAAAGLSIGASGATGAWAALLGYTALAGSTVLLPILAYATAPARFDPVLYRVKDWIDRRHAELTAVILVVIGIVLLYQGIRAA
jgi:threonine/homoserine/homoserine lactone efflux protein